mmetsp:Transcript_14009/g.35235  ORF Transcript_14009/g.35235 Transcript_14009/m.35235 type:complete len:308 (+) Transcript_14009:165-1088(+)
MEVEFLAATFFFCHWLLLFARLALGSLAIVIGSGVVGFHHSELLVSHLQSHACMVTTRRHGSWTVETRMKLGMVRTRRWASHHHGRFWNCDGIFVRRCSTVTSTHGHESSCRRTSSFADLFVSTGFFVSRERSNVAEITNPLIGIGTRRPGFRWFRWPHRPGTIGSMHERWLHQLTRRHVWLLWMESGKWRSHGITILLTVSKVSWWWPMTKGSRRNGSPYTTRYYSMRSRMMVWSVRWRRRRPISQVMALQLMSLWWCPNKRRKTTSTIHSMRPRAHLHHRVRAYRHVTIVSGFATSRRLLLGHSQ